MPHGSRKVAGHAYRRIRVGDFRVIYEFDEDSLSVILVGRRDEVYRRLQK